ncbi:hypothetical protein CANMA_003505 [Candida margitis]|uniref:uncharacterized protein n=1 Tax=Candida margitis TaxID=1775924 RepID=UPI00222611AA|nr:uncharacterized protein CANMA_003505 [Candida margitis]KAI5964994.1 hypothetical protein CANMA_003505 [Candida margitis]
MSEKEQSRKLRSEDSSNVASNKNLFNFDNINAYLYQDKPIFIDNSGKDQLYHYFKGDEETPTLRVTDVKQIARKLPRRRTKVDPLPDPKYGIFHRKMKKEETQMLNEEKIKNLVEVDNLNTSLQLLNQYDWIRHLPLITKINNAMDYEEMERKKDLTINEIEKLLEKQALWKKKRDRFINDARQFHNGGSVAVANAHALDQTRTSSFKAHPTGTTNNSHENHHLKTQAHTTNPVAIKSNVKLDNLDSSTEINLRGTSNELFGVGLHEIEPPKTGFQLPLGWRRQMGNKS